MNQEVKNRSKTNYESLRRKAIRERTEESDLFIDMWYGDKFNKRDYAASCTFYPNEGEYRGNIYRLSDGKIVGDYSCSDSVVVAKELGVDFDK